MRLLYFKDENKTHLGSCSSFVQNNLFTSLTKKICWQEKNKSPIGAGKPLLPSGGCFGTLQKVGSWVMVPQPRVDPRGKGLEVEDCPEFPYHGGRPSGR